MQNASLAFLLLFSLTVFAKSPVGSELRPFDFQQFQIRDSGLPGTKTLALTFDDGPSAQTDQLLKMLNDEHVPATFFMNGLKIIKHPEFLPLMQGDRQILANHTETHPKLNDYYIKHPAELVAEVNKTHLKIKDHLTPGQRLYFRAPFGIWRGQHARLLNRSPVLRKYIGPIYWDVGGAIEYDSYKNLISAADWDCWKQKWTPAECLTGYVAEATTHTGGVVLMHDVNLKTIELARKFIQHFRAEGYRFISLDDIRAYDQYE